MNPLNGAVAITIHTTGATVLQIEVEVLRLTQLDRDYSCDLPAGESAILATHMIIHPTLADVMPLTTFIWPLTSTSEGRHVYKVTTRGYTIEQFVAIATAYSDERVDDAHDLIEALRPPSCFRD